MIWVLLKEKHKYQDYNYVICEKCNRQIIKQYYYCEYCYEEETDKNVIYRMIIYGSNIRVFDDDLDKVEIE